MQPHTHIQGRDTDATWNSPGAKTKKPAKKKSTKKQPPAKSTKKKSSAKKSSAKKSSAKKSSAKKQIVKAPRGTPSSTSVGQLLARLSAPDSPELQAIEAELRRRLAGRGRNVDAASTVTALRLEIAGLERQVADLSHKLAELTTTVTGLVAADAIARVAGQEIVEDPFLRWLQDPSIERYRGRHVAIHQARGVVADGESLRDVIASVRAQDIPLDDICLATVPASH